MKTNRALKLVPAPVATRCRRSAFEVWKDALNAHRTNGQMTPAELHVLGDLAHEVATDYEFFYTERLDRKKAIAAQIAALRAELNRA